MKNDIRAEDYEEIIEEKELTAQEILNEIEREKKHEEEWVKWWIEQHYNNTHPTIKKHKNPKFKHSKPQKQTIRNK